MIYLDHAATSPLTAAALSAWTEAAREVGNPSSLHGAGRAARRIVEKSREVVADRLGASPGHVVFTSGGTEADNLAVLGLARARRAADAGKVKILYCAVEHHAVLEPARHLAAEGFEPVELPVAGDGRLDVAALKAELDRDAARVALVTVQWTNNETGAVQPVAEVGALARAAGVPFHCDAVQAVAHAPVTAAAADALTVSAHKLGGPVGVGALVIAPGTPLTPTSFGGGQERRVRSGTIPAALVASFAAALDEAVARRETEAARLAALSARLIAGLDGIDGVAVLGPALVPELGPSRGAGGTDPAGLERAGRTVPVPGPSRGASGTDLAGLERAGRAAPGTGPSRGDSGGAGNPGPGGSGADAGQTNRTALDASHRSPHIVAATFDGCLGEDLLLLLDADGIAVSTGSACTAGVAQPSHVLLAMGLSESAARSGLRVSFGPDTGEADVDALLAALPAAVARARRVGGV